MKSELNQTGSASLTYNGKSVDFPVFKAAHGPDVFDIRALYKHTGAFTFDPGLYLHGELRIKNHFYRWRPRRSPLSRLSDRQLAENSDFIEVAYLLLKDHLPTKEELKDFDNSITQHTMVHEQLKNFYNGFRRDAHPMAIMVGVVGALAAFYHDSTDISDPNQRRIASHRDDRQNADHRRHGL